MLTNFVGTLVVVHISYIGGIIVGREGSAKVWGKGGGGRA